MERCEKIPAETYEARNRSNMENSESRLWPRVDREGKSLGDVEYVAPSPPEREQQPPQTLSHADLEAYVRSYQDPQVGQVSVDKLNNREMEDRRIYSIINFSFLGRSLPRKHSDSGRARGICASPTLAAGQLRSVRRIPQLRF